MEAAGDQVLTYVLPGGEERGHFFGSHPVIAASDLLALNSERREVTVYDLATSQQRQQYLFAEPVAFKAFSGDGKRLLVFTSDQTIYILDMGMASMTSEAGFASDPAK